MPSLLPRHPKFIDSWLMLNEITWTPTTVGDSKDPKEVITHQNISKKKNKFWKLLWTIEEWYCQAYLIAVSVITILHVRTGKLFFEWVLHLLAMEEMHRTAVSMSRTRKSKEVMFELLYHLYISYPTHTNMNALPSRISTSLYCKGKRHILYR